VSNKKPKINKSANASRLLKTVSKSYKILLQTSVAIGFIIFIAYLHDINIYPRDISIGDSMLFAALTIGFGFLYTYILVMQVYLVCLFDEIISGGFAPYKIFYIVLSSLILIVDIFLLKPILYDISIISVLSIGYYIFIRSFSIYKLDNEAITINKNQIAGDGKISEDGEIANVTGNKANKIETIKVFRCISVPLREYNHKNFIVITILFMLLPLIASQTITKTLIKASFAYIGVRKEHAAIFIKRDYFDNISNIFYHIKDKTKSDNMVQLNDITVLLSGIGKDVVISVPIKENPDINKKDDYISWSIPSDEVSITSSFKIINQESTSGIDNIIDKTKSVKATKKPATKLKRTKTSTE